MDRSPHRASLSNPFTLRRLPLPSPSDAPASPDRPSRPSRPATCVAALLGLLIGLAVAAAPAQAAGRPDRARTTVVGGWTAPTAVDVGSAYVARVRVSGGRRLVVLQRRVGGTWRPVAQDRSTATGRAVLRWTPREDGRVALRLRVRPTPRHAAMTTPARLVRVVDDARVAPQVPEVPAVPVPELPVPEVPAPEVPAPPVPEVVTDPVVLEVLALVNEVRATGHVCRGVAMPAVEPVRADARLSRAALGHATSMAEHDYVSHTGLDGSTYESRAVAEGYPFRNGGEVIAAGYVTAASTVTGWLESTSGHCEILMSADVTDLGLGSASDPESYYGTYWALVLARSL